MPGSARRRGRAAALAAGLVAASAWASAWPGAPLHAADTVTTRLNTLEQRVTHLEALAAARQNQATELVTLTRWSAAFKQDQLSKSYQIAYTLKNHCGKAIKIINGTLDFYGPDGKQVYRVPLSGDASIEADGQATLSGLYYINPTRPEELKLRDLPHNQVSTRVQLRRIVFRDNTVLPLE